MKSLVLRLTAIALVLGAGGLLLWRSRRGPSPQPAANGRIMADYRIIPLTLPSGAPELLRVRVDTGPLPFGSRLEVSLGDGTPAGAIAPFGRTAYETGGSHTLLVPRRSEFGDHSLDLFFRLVPREGPARLPTDTEVKAATIAPER